MAVRSTESVPRYDADSREALCGVLVTVEAAASKDAAHPVMRVAGRSDRCAVYLMATSAYQGCNPEDSVTVEWTLYHGIKTAMEGTPAATWTSVYNPIGGSREGLIGIAWGRPSTEWTLYGRTTAPAGASIRCSVAMVADNCGGATSPPGNFAGSMGT